MTEKRQITPGEKVGLMLTAAERTLVLDLMCLSEGVCRKAKSSWPVGTTWPTPYLFRFRHPYHPNPKPAMTSKVMLPGSGTLATRNPQLLFSVVREMPTLLPLSK